MEKLRHITFAASLSFAALSGEPAAGTGETVPAIRPEVRVVELHTDQQPPERIINLGAGLLVTALAAGACTNVALVYQSRKSGAKDRQ